MYIKCPSQICVFWIQILINKFSNNFEANFNFFLFNLRSTALKLCNQRGKKEGKRHCTLYFLSVLRLSPFFLFDCAPKHSLKKRYAALHHFIFLSVNWCRQFSHKNISLCFPLLKLCMFTVITIKMWLNG